MNRIFSMVMWTGKAATFLLGLAVALALALAITAGAAEAAKAPTLKAGVQNVVKATTSIAGSVAGPVLRLDNDGSGTALDLRVEPGNAPITVDSDEQVANLNADEVDGFDANGLMRVAFDQRTGNVAIGLDGTMASEEIIAPIDGFLVISASAAGRNQDVRDLISCEIRVDGEAITSSNRVIELNGDQNVSEREICATDTVAPVAAGSHRVDFEAVDIGSSSSAFANPSLWVIFVPFDGEGEQPGASE